MPRSHREHHRTDRIGSLRAAVLGANDGIVSTASLLLGVAAANAAPGDVGLELHALPRGVPLPVPEPREPGVG